MKLHLQPILLGIFNEKIIYIRNWLDWKKWEIHTRIWSLTSWNTADRHFWGDIWDLDIDFEDQVHALNASNGKSFSNLPLFDIIAVNLSYINFNQIKLGN